MYVILCKYVIHVFKRGKGNSVQNKMCLMAVSCDDRSSCLVKIVLHFTFIELRRLKLVIVPIVCNKCTNNSKLNF